MTKLILFLLRLTLLVPWPLFSKIVMDQTFCAVLWFPKRTWLGCGKVTVVGCVGSPQEFPQCAYNLHWPTSDSNVCRIIIIYPRYSLINSQKKKFRFGFFFCMCVLVYCIDGDLGGGTTMSSVSSVRKISEDLARNHLAGKCIFVFFLLLFIGWGDLKMDVLSDMVWCCWHGKLVLTVLEMCRMRCVYLDQSFFVMTGVNSFWVGDVGVQKKKIRVGESSLVYELLVCGW